MQDLPDPIVRAHAGVYQPLVWPDGERVQLAARWNPLNLDFAKLIEERQTRRDFHRIPTLSEMGDFLWFACRSRNSAPSPYGPDLESRAHPSAGALHPIHVLLAADGQPWSRYEPTTHALIELTATVSIAAATRAMASHVLPADRAMVIALVAEPGKSACKYDHVDTLVWRDAGIVLGYMSVVAEALGLAFCPLGPTGHGISTNGLPNADKLRGVGLALVSSA